MRSHLASIVIAVLLVVGAVTGADALNDKPRPATAAPAPSFAEGDVQFERSGDLLVMHNGLPAGCELPGWAAFKLLEGAPQIISSVERPHARCVYRDDVTDHQAALTVVFFRDDATLRAKKTIPTLFAESIPSKISSDDASIVRPRGLKEGAWARTDELADGRRRLIVVWHDHSQLHKLVVRKHTTAAPADDLNLAIDIAKKLASGWEPNS